MAKNNTAGAQIVASSDQGTVVYEIKDKKAWWHYDTVVLPGGQEVPTEIRFFQIPKGQQGKDEIDTNVSQYGTLPAGWHLAIYAIRFAVLDGKIEDIKKVVYNSVLTLELGGTFQPFQAPTWIFTQGGGLYGEVEIDGATSETRIDLVTNGLPAPQSILRLPQSITVKGGETFNIVMKVKPGITIENDVKLQVVLDCIAFQPIRGT